MDRNTKSLFVLKFKCTDVVMHILTDNPNILDV